MPENPSTPLILNDLIDAIEFVSSSQTEEFHANICKQTGRIMYVGDGLGSDDAADLSDDPEAAGFEAPRLFRRQFSLGYAAISRFSRAA